MMLALGSCESSVPGSCRGQAACFSVLLCLDSIICYVPLEKVKFTSFNSCNSCPLVQIVQICVKSCKRNVFLFFCIFLSNDRQFVHFVHFVKNSKTWDPAPSRVELQSSYSRGGSRAGSSYSRATVEEGRGGLLGGKIMKKNKNKQLKKTDFQSFWC